ncbi:MAG: PorV/PorQ family protein [Elusimicrobiales bacterium]|nr:PorV/PorQ family protein [Elusimicrobiales bacterium]
MKKIIISIMALMFPTAISASGAGTTAANFLKVSMNARAIAMGGAFSALADDSGAIFSNPAGLAGFTGQELGFGFTTYLEGSKMGNISYAADVSGNRFGFGMTALNISGIERRGLNDSAGIVSSLGDFGSNDMAVSLAYACKDSFSSILENMDSGFTLKFIKSTIDDSSAFAVAVDAGIIYHAGEKTNVSLVLQNLGSKMKYEEESDPLPLDLKVGMLHRSSNRLNLTAELNQYFIDEKFYPSFGVEYWFRDAFALRGGYKFGYDTSNLGREVGLSLGFGVKVADLGVDYAYLPFGDLGNIHRFGFWLQF